MSAETYTDLSGIVSLNIEDLTVEALEDRFELCCCCCCCCCCGGGSADSPIGAGGS